MARGWESWGWKTRKVVPAWPTHCIDSACYKTNKNATFLKEIVNKIEKIPLVRNCGLS